MVKIEGEPKRFTFFIANNVQLNREEVHHGEKRL